MKTKDTHNHTDFYKGGYDFFNVFQDFIKSFFPQHAFNQYIFIPVLLFFSFTS